MKITTTTGLVGFILALSTLNAPEASANAGLPEPEVSPTIDARLAAITEALRVKEAQFAKNPSLLSLPEEWRLK
jgi:rSAM-associated Gly-rich repeat protein